MLAHLLADPETGSESSESDVDNFCSGVLPNSASCSDDGEILEGNSEESDYGEETEPHPLPALEILNRFCLKIREEALLSNNAVERIRIVTVSLLKKTAQQSKDKVNKVLQDNGIDPSTMPELQDAFQPSSWEHGSAELIDRGDYRNFFPNISPQEITLGKKRQWKKLKNGKRRIAEHPEKFYYVSLLASLEILLNNEKILGMVAEPKVSESKSGLLSDIMDGTTMQTHKLFSSDSQSLKIILYYDDVEITNEQTKRKHKMSMFYFQLANLYPEYRLKLKSINLLAIVEYQYLKKYGMDAILTPFVEELKKLGQDDGIDFNVHGGMVRLRGALLAVVADTPAAQLLGRFKESVGGAKQKCCHCMTDFEEMQCKFEEDDFVLRTKELHEYHLQQLEDNEGLFEHFSRVWSHR